MKFGGKSYGTRFRLKIEKRISNSQEFIGGYMQFLRHDFYGS